MAGRHKRSAALLTFLIFVTPVLAQSPQLSSQDGRYLGNLNRNRVSNTYGRYRSRFAPDYGSPTEPASRHYSYM